MTNKYDKKHLPFGHSSAIQDNDTLAVLENLKPVTASVFDSNVVENFLQQYRSWISSTVNNTFIGLESFPYHCFTNGTTEAFDKFYINNSTRRFRCFKGEYLYHRLAWRNSNLRWAYIEDHPLDTNDAVIISYPFADTGGKHKNLEEIISRCEQLNIPVLVDCAYFGLCGDLTFDLTSPCIREVTFSLSKIFPVSHIRIGMRLSRVDNDDALFVLNKNGYVNRLAAHIGQQFISSFGPDYIYNKYRSRQLNICELLKVKPSNSVIFGLGGHGWEEYNRDTETNRLGLHKFLHLDNLNVLEQYVKNQDY